MKVAPPPDYQNVAPRLSRRRAPPAFDGFVSMPERHRRRRSQ
jgi:hypothetical protein